MSASQGGVNPPGTLTAGVVLNPPAMGPHTPVYGPQPPTHAGLALLLSQQQHQLVDRYGTMSSPHLTPPSYASSAADLPHGRNTASMRHSGGSPPATQSMWGEPSTSMPVLAHVATARQSSFNASVVSGMSGGGSIRASSSGGTGSGVVYPLRALGADGSPGSPYAQGVVGSTYMGVPVGTGAFNPALASMGRRHSHDGPAVAAPRSPRSSGSELAAAAATSDSGAGLMIAHQQQKNSMSRMAQANNLQHIQRQGSGAGSPKPPRPPRKSEVVSAEAPAPLEAHLPQPRW